MLEQVPLRRRAVSLVIPVTIGAVVFAAAPAYSDETFSIAAAPFAAMFVAGALLLPAVFAVVMVRTQAVWALVLTSLSVAAAVGAVAVVRSSDAQAGLQILWATYIGSAAVLVLAIGDGLLRLRRVT